MARRKSRKSKPRRSTTKSINLFNVAEAGLIANAVTQGFFNCSINDFVFSKDGSSGTLGKTAITGREIIAGLTGGVGGYGTSTTSSFTYAGQTLTSTLGQSFGDQVKENLTEGGGQMLASLIAIPIAFRVGAKLTKKPRAIVNKIGKMSGLPMRV